MALASMNIATPSTLSASGGPVFSTLEKTQSVHSSCRRWTISSTISISTESDAMPWATSSIGMAIRTMARIAAPPSSSRGSMARSITSIQTSWWSLRTQPISKAWPNLSSSEAWVSTISGTLAGWTTPSSIIQKTRYIRSGSITESLSRWPISGARISSSH